MFTKETLLEIDSIPCGVKLPVPQRKSWNRQGKEPMTLSEASVREEHLVKYKLSSSCHLLCRVCMAPSDTCKQRSS